MALLSALGSGATAVLLKHAKAEISDRVRDAILHTLEKSGVALPAAPGNLAERVAAMPKLKKPLARRLDVTKGIVKLDDVGAWLLTKRAAAAKAVGRVLLLAAPKLMKLLTIVGTAAMFMVGGSILVHGLPPVHHFIEHAAPGAGALGWLVSLPLAMAVGVVAGALALGVMEMVSKVRGKNGEH